MKSLPAVPLIILAVVAVGAVTWIIAGPFLRAAFIVMWGLGRGGW